VVDESRLDDLASAVADGARIDWDRAEHDARDGAERAVVRELQVVAKMTDAVRSSGSITPAPPAGDRLKAGEMWGHLRIIDAIGEGTFGTVYCAWDTRLECEVALKLIRESGISQEFDLSRAIKEARLLARVQHKNVVRVFGADSHDQRFGLWMESVQGRTLERLLAAQGPRGVSEAIPIGIDLCHALAAVHNAGLLHRDVKAQNVLREDGGRIVLMDFGTGRQIQGGSLTDSLAGTPLYLAPELFAGKKPSVQSDIYSLGVLLYHLVTKDYPVRGTSRQELEAAHSDGRRCPLRDTRPDLSPPFIDVIERALASNPAERYKSAGEFGNALAAVSGRPYSSEAEPGWFHRYRWQLAMATLAIVGVLAMSLINRQPAEAPTTIATPASVPASPSTDAPYNVSASFYATREGRDVRLTHGSRVRPGDKLFATVHASQPVFVYIVNRDEAGQSFLLFPLPGLNPGNPIQAKDVVRLPGTMNGQEHYWEVTSVGGREHFFLYVTPRRLVEFEQILAALPRAEVGRVVSSRPLSTSAIGVLRGVGGLSAATNAPTSPPPTDLADLQPLSNESESASGVWARRVSFENPAE